MRKLLSGGLAVFAGIVSLPSPRSLHAERTPPVNRCKIDMRLERLKAFFGKLDCPAKDYSVDFIAVAERYDLDWRLLPSISLIESGGGKAMANNNLLGWGSADKHFPSVRAAIHTVASRLANSKLYRDKDLEGILNTYNPRPEYSYRVRSVMRQLGTAELGSEALN